MMPGDDKYERPFGVLFGDEKKRRIAGQLNVKRGDLLDSNVVSICDEKFFRVERGGALHGISEAGKVSLIDCVSGGMLSATIWDDFAIHHGDVAFRYALFGKQHVTADEKCIRGIQFTLEGVESSVFRSDRFGRFGHIHDPDEEIIDAITRKRPHYLKGDFVKGKAMVSYFTGDWNVLPTHETVLGTVHVGRTMHVDLSGRKMEDTPIVAVDFDDNPTTLEGAWEKMREIRQFFAWMMGYAPEWNDVVVFTSKLNDDGYRMDADGHLEVFGPNEWKEVPETKRQYGSLIDASRNPEHFMKVMEKWLERNGNERRKSANTRFFGCFLGTTNRVIEDGIVSAGNTFDLLPDEDKPKATPLPDDVVQVLEGASEKIKRAMAPQPERDGVLSALGDIRAKVSLRDIVEYRARVVLGHFGEDKLKNLEEVIRLAVKCRNHFTHGPSDKNVGGVDFSDFDVVRFLTETLEFIYGASELLRCGWDTTTSVADAWHPLGGYVKSYDYNRAVLKLK